MVLVDTSVWIRYLSGREPYLGWLRRLLEDSEVAGHDLVFGELLIGNRGGRQRVLDDYLRIQRAATIPHWEVAQLVRSRRLAGRGVGWIDVHLLASALVGRLRLWTADPRFAALAAELSVDYRP
jgi:hypothetical protein